jgi:hypothetical protein
VKPAASRGERPMPRTPASSNGATLHGHDLATDPLAAAIDYSVLDPLASAVDHSVVDPLAAAVDEAAADPLAAAVDHSLVEHSLVGDSDDECELSVARMPNPEEATSTTAPGGQGARAMGGEARGDAMDAADDDVPPSLDLHLGSVVSIRGHLGSAAPISICGGEGEGNEGSGGDEGVSDENGSDEGSSDEGGRTSSEEVASNDEMTAHDEGSQATTHCDHDIVDLVAAREAVMLAARVRRCT